VVDQRSADELRRGVDIRARAIENAAERILGPIPHSREDLRSGLDLLALFAKTTQEAVGNEWDRNLGNPDAQISVITPLLQRLNVGASLLERHFTHGDRPELAESLTREIKGVLKDLELEQYRITTSHGDPDNFVTTHGDLEGVLFGPLLPIIAQKPALTGRPYALFRIPRVEGAGLYWRPILLGHEVAHLAVEVHKAIEAFDLPNKFDFKLAATLPSQLASPLDTDVVKQKGLFDIATNWLTELLCDAFALYRYGPAALAAMGEYCNTIGALDLLSITHPPGSIRLRLLSHQLQKVEQPRFEEVVAPYFFDILDDPKVKEPWADALYQLFATNADAIVNIVSAWPALEYSWRARTEVVYHIVDRLERGIPGGNLVEVEGERVWTIDADFVNAAWIARIEDASTPVNDLGMKGLEAGEFCRRWFSHGGAEPIVLREISLGDVEAERGILSAPELLRRMSPRCERRLEVVPLLQEPKGSALDLRLGNRFIIFRRTSVAAFDPIAEEGDPRIVQSYIELDWSEQLVLHPNEMVLGASLEYIALPGDLAAQVVSRSSYGRLGLLSATAVQVHPFFHGCLTLELVNLSTIPLCLSPGERVAQLVVTTSGLADDPGIEKYSYATGPEFSKVRDDHEAEVLRKFRN
jgi:deoxycytidine triphosphate deaminase